MLPKIVKYTVTIDTRKPEVHVTEDQLKKALDYLFQYGINASIPNYGADAVPIILESSIEILEVLGEDSK